MAGLEFNGISVTSEQLVAFKAWLSVNGGFPAGDFAPGSLAAAQVGTANKAGLLRAIAAKADAGNAATLPPWSLPPAFALGAVTAGDIRVTSAGRVYYAQFGGTATVEPTQEYPAALAADGTLIWVYMGSVGITASDPMAPTVTTGGLSTISATYGNNNYYPQTQPQHFTLLDALDTLSSFGAAQPRGWPDGSGARTAAGGAIAFETEAAAFAISYPFNGSAFRVKIDGRWRTIEPETMLKVQTGANNFNYTLFTFPGGVKKRRIEIDTSRIGGTNPQAIIYGVHLSTHDQVRPVKVSSTLGVVADSWGAGVGYAYINGNRFPQKLRDRLGFDQLFNLSTGGTGYDNKGPSSAFYNFAERLEAIVPTLTTLPDMWVLAGSGNDNLPAALVGAGLTRCAAAIRSRSKSVPIVIFGVQPWNDGQNNAYIAANEAKQIAAVAALNDPLVFYRPCYGDPKGPWLSGSWNNGATPGTGRAGYVNSGWLLGNDQIHGYDIGYDYWAARIETDIRNNVYPAL